MNSIMTIWLTRLQTCCRAASVLSHVIKNNNQCKERVWIEINFILMFHLFTVKHWFFYFVTNLARMTIFFFVSHTFLSKRKKKRLSCTSEKYLGEKELNFRILPFYVSGIENKT